MIILHTHTHTCIEKEFNDILSVSTRGIEDTTVQETLILDFANSNESEDNLNVIRNVSPELNCEIDGTSYLFPIFSHKYTHTHTHTRISCRFPDESRLRLERIAKRGTEISVRTEELRCRVRKLATAHHKMMEMLSLKFLGTDKLLGEMESR